MGWLRFLYLLMPFISLVDCGHCLVALLVVSSLSWSAIRSCLGIISGSFNVMSGLGLSDEVFLVSSHDHLSFVYTTSLVFSFLSS